MKREPIVPEDLRYSREHEWLRLEDERTGVVGITDYAQQMLGDVVFLSLPEVGTQVRFMEKCGEIESPKAVSDLYSPVSGEVVEVNNELLERPELVNQDPYQQGWMLRIALNDPSEVDQLLTAEQYRRLIRSQGATEGAR
jgi:glycine cleavage system H protein